MALGHGPAVVTNGLVLALDAADTNSFKGEVTTNELVAITWSGDGTAQSGMSFGSTAVTQQYLKYKGYETYLWSPGSSLNCYLNGADVDVNRTSTVWTFSCYVKREDGAAITSLNVYMYYPTSDGSAAGTIEDVGNGWYRVSRTRTGTSSNITLAGFTGFVAGYRYYLSGAQLEKKSYATTPATVNTTRGSTVAAGGGWADLTGRGNNGELFNGMRESSTNKGSLNFDGTDDYILGTIPSTTFSGAHSICCWFYRRTVTDWAGLFSNNVNTTSCSIFTFISTSNTLGTNQAGVNGTSIAVDLGADHLNKWIYAVITYTGATNGSTVNVYAYKNGSLLSATGSLYWSLSTSSSYYIGRHWTSATQILDGFIPQVQVYNRALTAAEISQNFNALRGRFGV